MCLACWRRLTSRSSVGCQSQRCLQGGEGAVHARVWEDTARNSARCCAGAFGSRQPGVWACRCACRWRERIAGLHACFGGTAAGSAEAGASQGHTRSSMPLLSDWSCLPSISVLHVGGAQGGCLGRNPREQSRGWLRQPAGVCLWSGVTPLINTWVPHSAPKIGPRSSKHLGAQHWASRLADIAEPAGSAPQHLSYRKPFSYSTLRDSGAVVR